jgi:hypothetical protein
MDSVLLDSAFGRWGLDLFYVRAAQIIRRREAICARVISGIHFVQPSAWHQLESRERNIQSAEWIALTPQNLQSGPLAAQLLFREFIFPPHAVKRSEGGDRSESG